MRRFQWLGACDIPRAWDLRNCGWQLAKAGAGPAGAQPCVVIVAPVARMDHAGWTELRHCRAPPGRAQVLFLGVDDSEHRARLLRQGFGDVLGGRPALAEIETRAQRIAASAERIPARRQVGPLLLDLLARDGFVADRGLGLHPREFALLWRLAEMPGTPVTKAVLLGDVWRLGHVPETNSLAVHVFRLRAKLAVAGIEAMVETAGTGGYRLVPPVPLRTAAIPMITGDSRLDLHKNDGADMGVANEEHRHEL